MSDHRPQRGSDVEAWLRDHRERCRDFGDRQGYLLLDSMLDDYRLRADMGRSLLPGIPESTPSPERVSQGTTPELDSTRPDAPHLISEESTPSGWRIQTHDIGAGYTCTRLRTPDGTLRWEWMERAR